MPLALLLLASVLPLAAQPTFERIDAHVHVAPPPPPFVEMLDRLKVRLLNVTLIDPTAPGFDKPEPQTAWAIDIAQRSGGRIAWVAAMDPSGFESAGFVRQETERLGRGFVHGAVAVKIYKSAGMNIKSASGKYLMPDDAALSPVLKFVAGHGKTLLAHLGDPKSSWLPLNPRDAHYGYFKENPAWHMYQHPEAPAWESIIAARDRLLQANPDLKVVGAHLGSMEHDVDELARRLENYPNFAVDTAARVPDLMRQPREKVRVFLIRYQDRVIWGTDLMELSWSNPAEAVRRWETAYERDWKFFATGETLQAGGRVVRGLDLPEKVLRKIFRENALRWMPALAAAFAPKPQALRSAALPAVEDVIRRFVLAMGGQDALANVKTRAFSGSLSVSTYGAYGEYQEIASAPDKYRRIFRFPGYAPIERGFDGKRAWEESPDYGIEALTGARLSEVRRQSVFHLALDIKSMYAKFSVKGHDTIDGQEAVVVQAVTPEGASDTLWFGAASGLLLGIESTETFANGVAQRVLYLFEDYKPVDGVQVAHGVRYESPRLIWVLKRQVIHNPPLEDTLFRPPDERK